MQVTDKIPPARVVTQATELKSSADPDDGTLTLLRTGFWITLGGLLALLATETLFGGIGIQGAQSNAGWLALMFALMSVPFGLMLLALGGAKWLRNRRLRRRPI